MCGVIGIKMRVPDLDLISRILIESKIRGLHATGVSYTKNKTIATIVKPVPADIFCKTEDFNQFIDSDGSISLIGHTRYSTSDLEYNQPIQKGDFAVAHNGVMTQEPYALWKEETITKNDSELLLNAFIRNSENPVQDWKDSSVACCFLNFDRSINFFRNGKRPLYYHQSNDLFVITSTKDIAVRSGLSKLSLNMTEFGVIYRTNDSFELQQNKLTLETKDLQICKF